MIHVLATIRVAAGKRDEFLTEFRKLVPLVRAEQGCIEYGAAIDVPTTLPAQLPLRDDVVMVVEKWDDLDALAAHLIAPHMLDYRARVKTLVLGTELQVLEPA
ncbi:MAG: antibiotic biosynthesis monooxygenase [Planctomycetaceae bacterium]|nr:antibiotic biosynthesis monooxygenase [Planctomycetaceae bacterium]